MKSIVKISQSENIKNYNSEVDVYEYYVEVP
nr:MAG TPA: hypothetical protein [Caudoviricetes sp.]